MKRKHSYRQLDKRRFNEAVLKALTNPAEVEEGIQFWSKYINRPKCGTHYKRIVDTLKKASAHAAGLKEEFSRLGKKMHLGNYTPYTNEIKQALFSTLQLELTL